MNSALSDCTMSIFSCSLSFQVRFALCVLAPLEVEKQEGIAVYIVWQHISGSPVTKPAGSEHFTITSLLMIILFSPESQGSNFQSVFFSMP